MTGKPEDSDKLHIEAVNGKLEVDIDVLEHVETGDDSDLDVIVSDEEITNVPPDSLIRKNLLHLC